MSLVLAADFRVADFERAWQVITDVERLASLHAHRVVLHRAIDEDDRVLLTMGVRDRRPLTEYLSAPTVRAWFDEMGVDDLPPVFTGEVVRKLEFGDPPSRLRQVPTCMVADIVRVTDFDGFWDAVLRGRDRFRAEGGIRCWAYQALDDPEEILLLREVDTEADAERWLGHLEDSAEWRRRAGVVDPYPPLFAGRLLQSISVPSQSAS